MAEYKSSSNSKDSTPGLHPPHEWLEAWHQLVFPLRNGATAQDYKPRIEKYIKDWVELYNDIDPAGRKFKVRDFDFVPVDIGSTRFKVTANPEVTSAAPVEAVNTDAVHKKRPTEGGGLPGEKPAGQHLIPPPPPPPK